MALRDLTPPPEPFSLEIIEGIRLSIMPMTLRSYCLAQAAAKDRLTGLEESVEQCRGAGLFDGMTLPDINNDAVRDGVYQEFLTIELGIAHIQGWEGILDDDDNPVPVTKEAVEAVLQNPIIGVSFYDRLMRWHVEYLRAKKDSGIAADGTSSPAAVPPTAKAANSTD